MPLPATAADASLAGLEWDASLADLEWEDDDLVALGVALQARVAVCLEARERRKRDLLLARILPHTPDAQRVDSMSGAALRSRAEGCDGGLNGKKAVVTKRVRQGC